MPDLDLDFNPYAAPETQLTDASDEVIAYTRNQLDGAFQRGMIVGSVIVTVAVFMVTHLF